MDMSTHYNMEEILITMRESEVKGKMVLPFYQAVAESLGISDSLVRCYDCRKICVASNIQDMIIEAYQLNYPDAFEKYPMDARRQVIMELAKSGPKVDRELKDFQVRVTEDFITFID